MLLAIEPKAEPLHYHNRRERETHSLLTYISLSALPHGSRYLGGLHGGNAFAQDAAQVFGRAVPIRFETLLPHVCGLHDDVLQRVQASGFSGRAPPIREPAHFHRSRVWGPEYLESNTAALEQGREDIDDQCRDLTAVWLQPASRRKPRSRK